MASTLTLTTDGSTSSTTSDTDECGGASSLRSKVTSGRGCVERTLASTEQALATTRTRPRARSRVFTPPRIEGPSLYAELVALRVLHHYPVLVALAAGPHHRGSHRDQPFRLGLEARLAVLERGPRSPADVQIEVHAVLDGLCLRHLLEEDPGTGPIGVHHRVGRVV